MAPVQLTTPPDEPEVEDQFDEASLLGEDGEPTLEAAAVARFLGDIDYTDLFDDPDVREYIEEAEAVVQVVGDEDTGYLLPLDPLMSEEEIDAIPEEELRWVTLETLDGAVAAEFIDEADLYGLFEYHVANELPSETLEDRAVMSLFQDVIDDLDEDELAALVEKGAFKKRQFKTGPLKGVSGASKGGAGKRHNQRARMFKAMMAKGVLQRVKKGSGYGGGDYKKGYAGAGSSGSKSKVKMYKKYVAKENPKRGAAIKKLVKGGRRKVVQVIYKNLGKKMPRKWIPPEDRLKGAAKGKGKKLALKKAAVKKGPGKAAAKKKMGAKKKAKPKAKKIGAGDVMTPAANITEGADLASAALNTKMAGVTQELREDAPAEKPADTGEDGD